MKSFNKFMAALLLSSIFIQPSHSAEVMGIKVDDTAKVGTHNLKLNGAGIRYKAIFKVYVAALYLNENKSTTAEVLALGGAKRVALTVQRDLSSEELGRRFMDGMKQNADVTERAKLVGAMLSFGQMFSAIPEMKKGDVLTVDLIPGTGTVSQLNGKKVGDTIPDPNFYNALLKIWLGPQPVDGKLKRELLGEKPAETNTQ